jgi:hypothetical protein
MVMARFHEIFVPLVRRSAGGRERTIAVPRAPSADDFSLAADERSGLLARLRAIA